MNEKIKVFVTEISRATSENVEKLTNNQNEASKNLETMIDITQQKISVRFEESLMIIGETCSNTVNRISTQFESISEKMSRVNNDFCETQTALREELKKAVGTIGEKLIALQNELTVNSTNKFAEINQNLITNIESTMRTQESVNLGLSNLVSSSQREINEQVKAFLDDISKFTTNSTIKITSHQTEVLSNLEKTLEITQKIITERFEESQMKIDKTCSNAMSIISTETTQNLSNFTTSVNSTISELTKELKILLGVSVNTNRNLNEQFSKVTTQIDSFTHHTHEKVNSLTQVLDNTITRFHPLIADIEKLTGSLKSQLSEYTIISNNLVQASKSINESSWNLSAFSIKAVEITEKINQIGGTFQNLSSESNQSLREVATSMSSAVTNLANEMKNIDEYFLKMNKNLDGYYRSVSDAFNNYTIHMDEHITRVFEHINSVLEPISDFGGHIEDLKEIIDGKIKLN